MKGMTGYASREIQTEKASIGLEIKTVNHRYLEINIKMPPYLNVLEIKIKELIKKHLIRGKVDLYIGIKLQSQYKVEPNFEVAKQYIDSFNKIIEHFSLNDSVKLFHITRYEDVLQTDKTYNSDEFWPDIQQMLTENLQDLNKMRFEEGLSTGKNLEGLISNCRENVTEIKSYIPQMEEAIFENIKNKMDELLGEAVEKERMASEAAVLVSKACVNEEIIRLEHHTTQFLKIMNEDGDVGKRLDFLCQEMHREINTIGSKTVSSDITDRVIQVKNNIEKLREQLRNIE